MEITKLKNELKEVVKSRQVQRKNRNRSNIRKIAIVGYTNAGKSTLLNAFVNNTSDDERKDVLVKDMFIRDFRNSYKTCTTIFKQRVRNY